MVRPRRSTRALARELLLSAGAVLGVLCLLAAVASIGFDVKPLIFRSGSMGPTIQTGALGLARTVPGTELRPGDVVSVVNATGTRVTHRVASTTSQGEVTTLVLKGDANRVPDAAPYVVVDADRLFFHVNRLGYIVSWLGGPFGTFLGGLLVGVLAMMALARGADSKAAPDRQGKAADTPQPRRAVTEDGPRSRGVATTVMALIVLASLLGTRLVPASAAAWVDTGTATSGRFTMLVVPNVTAISCNLLSVGSITFSWPAVSGAGSYLLTVTPTSGAEQSFVVQGTSQEVTKSGGLLTGGTATVRTLASGTSTWYSTGTTRGYSAALGGLYICL